MMEIENKKRIFNVPLFSTFEHVAPVDDGSVMRWGKETLFVSQVTAEYVAITGGINQTSSLLRYEDGELKT